MIRFILQEASPNAHVEINSPPTLDLYIITLLWAGYRQARAFLPSILLRLKLAISLQRIKLNAFYLICPLQ
ncbi:MAG: hypothetical protein IJ328_02620 [Muribaculaceae bacterium]|nr:hypothetical protein [Muribaculaceae bacterium]